MKNTTYVLNFGNAIVDVTESNPIIDFKYAFSTGSVVDSLTLSGKINASYSHELQEGFLVMLYPSPINDSTPLKHLPKYISRSNKEGEYLISNIGTGTYSIFGLKDGNNNYIFDNPEEEIAFLNQEIEINTHVSSIDLNSFKQAEEKQYILSQKESNSKLDLIFNLPNDSINFKGVDTSLYESLLHLDQNKNRDTLTFWWKEMNEVKVKMRIDNNANFIDTIKFKIDSFPLDGSFKLLSNLSTPKNFFQAIPLKFNHPLRRMDTTRISVRKADSTEISFELYIDPINKKLAHLTFPFEEDSSYSLQLMPGAIEDIYGRTNDTLTGNVSFNKLEDFGKLILKLNVENNDKKIIQLTDPKGKTLRESKLRDNLVEFEHLKPGNYRLRLIIDSNEDGTWSTGNYLNKVQPERTVLFDEDIVIRKNWDKEIEWVIN